MDLAHYRRAEALAKQQMPSWREAQAHTPHLFASVGFPIRVESTADLAALTDTMQEGRYEKYMAELGGLRESEFLLLKSVLADFARFFAGMFHTGQARLPLDTMLAHYAVYNKIRRANPNAWNIIELGPGCGYLSFFLSREAGRYTQIETTESFYLLQHHVNNWCFGGQQDEKAAIPYENQGIGVNRKTRVSHVPWWRAKEVQGPFDIVTANAMLSEVRPEALYQFAELIGRSLSPEGYVIVQCFGQGGNVAGVKAAFEAHGLLMLTATQQVDGRQLAVGNGIFCRADNPNPKDPAAILVDQTSAERRLYTREDFERALCIELQRCA